MMKPNILLISADQWRGDCLSALGHAVQTPHVDALAREGVLFARHYAGAAPCSPARASLYTGLYQMNHRVCRNGSPLDGRFDNLALAARRAGYDPILFGYTDTAPDPRDFAEDDPHLKTYEGVLPGFTTRLLLTEHQKTWLSWLRSRGHAAATSRDVHRPVGTALPEVTRAGPAYGADETESAFVADEFIRWLGEQDSPWFAHVSFIRPHPPFVVPEPYASMYPAPEADAFRRAADRASEMAVHPFLAFDLPRQNKASFLHGVTGAVADWSAEEISLIRALYYGMITEVDHQFGRMVEAIRAAGGWDNTIIIFTSDHAELAGDHWSFGKGGFFDGSYHIPLVIRDPAMAARGAVVEDFTSAVDIFPTLAERLGIAPANHLDGEALTPFLETGAAEGWRDAVFFEFDFRDIENAVAEHHFGLPSNACNLAVLRDRRYKYVHFTGLPPLLYDLSDDPGERVNRAEDPTYLPIRLALAERLLAHRARHLDQTLAYSTLTDDGVVTRGGPSR